MIWPLLFNTLRPRLNGRHFADDIFKCIFLNENAWITITISLKFIPKGPISNIPALVQIMAWHRPSDKPLSEPMMFNLPTHICVTRPQWVNGLPADVSEKPNNALTTRMHGDYRPSIDRFFVGFNAMCYAILRNNPIYIETRNCSFSTVQVLFNKCSGLRPSDTLSSWWLGWRCHARVGKPFFGKSLSS